MEQVVLAAVDQQEVLEALVELVLQESLVVQVELDLQEVCIT